MNCTIIEFFFSNSIFSESHSNEQKKRSSTELSNRFYYYYLYLIDLMLRQLAEDICLKKLNEAKMEDEIIADFDA